MTNRRSALVLAVEIFILLAIVVFLAGSARTKVTISNRICLGTACSITVYGNASKAKSAIGKAWDAVTELENHISVNLPYSEVSLANAIAGSGQWLEISEQTYELVDFAIRMSDKTSGAMNPALGSLIAMWGIGTDDARVPEKAELDAALASAKVENILLECREDMCFIQITDASTVLNLGAVGKGWAADVAAKVLSSCGIENALLDFGGNIYALGKFPTTFGARDFSIGLQDPDQYRGMNFSVVSVHNLSVVTSGSYERFFEGPDGHRYSHIIDPSTGWSIENDIQSVSIIGPSSAVCDAMSTSFFILGPEGAASVLQDGFDGYFAVFLLGNGADRHVVQVGSDGILE